MEQWHSFKEQIVKGAAPVLLLPLKICILHGWDDSHPRAAGSARGVVCWKVLSWNGVKKEIIMQWFCECWRFPMVAVSSQEDAKAAGSLQEGSLDRGCAELGMLSTR